LSKRIHREPAREDEMNIRPGSVIYVFRSMTSRVVEAVDGRFLSVEPEQTGLLAAAFRLVAGTPLLPPGLRLMLNFERYRHYGVYDGRGKVIHFTGPTPSSARIRRTTLAEFERGTFLDSVAGGVLGVHTDDRVAFPDGRAEAVRRARAALGTTFGGYDLLRNNCEHFATWCACGRRISRQLLEKSLTLGSFARVDGGCSRRNIA